jgi:hypothetical protein
MEAAKSAADCVLLGGTRAGRVLRRRIQGEVQLTSDLDHPKRLVTLRREGKDFVVSFYPEDIVVFRNADSHALRKMCTFLRWKIISDTAASDDEIYRQS